jgi:hypothetical protein
MNRLEEYPKIYQRMVDSQGYFVFRIKCYHYVSTGRVAYMAVTHTAKRIFRVNRCVD